MIQSKKYARTVFLAHGKYLKVVYTLGAFSSSSPMQSQNIPQTYQVIEQVFDAAKAHLAFQTNTYFIYGHSAGAQFVHRFLLFLPDSRVEAAICANAGWYTMMADAIRFPYGLKGSGITEETLTRAFRKKLVILLGDQDTNPHHAHLNRSSQARAQGKHRLARGKRFYESAVQKADDLQTFLNWELHLIHGVGHSNIRMAERVMPFLPQIRHTGHQ
jgi:pimeloyl-ACP methyl ester carboxylesterase